MVTIFTCVTFVCRGTKKIRGILIRFLASNGITLPSIVYTYEFHSRAYDQIIFVQTK
jgi:hypothetical protein